MALLGWIINLDPVGGTPAPTDGEGFRPGTSSGGGGKKKPKPWWHDQWFQWPYEERSDQDRKRRMRKVERRVARSRSVEKLLATAQAEREALAAEVRFDAGSFERIDRLLEDAQTGFAIMELRRDLAVELERARMDAITRRLEAIRADDERALQLIVELI